MWFYRALQDNQEKFDRLVGVVVCTVPVGDSFSPENVGRILGAERARRRP